MKKSQLHISKYDLFIQLFIIALSSLSLAFIICFIRNPFGDQMNIIFARGKDYMADFFNVIKYSAGQDPYHDPVNGLGEKAYLPITYMLFHFFGHLANYPNPDASTLGLISATFIIAILTAILLIQLYDLNSGNKFYKTAVTFLIALSGIFIFSFERGNIVFLAVICCTFFIAGYNSENKIVRELALIALAVASALKGYPAVLGILLLYDRRFFDALRCAIYGMIAMFLPFLYFSGGFSNIDQWQQNLKSNTAQYRYGIFPRFGGYYFLRFFTETARITAGKTLFAITCSISLIGLFAALFHRKAWKKLGIIISIILLVPVNSALYCGLYLLPVIIMFLNDKDHSWFDLLYLLIFITILNPFQFIYANHSMTLLLMNIGLVILLAALLVDGLIIMVKKINNKEKEIVSCQQV